MKIFLSAPISTSGINNFEVNNASIINIKKQIIELPFIDNVFYAGDGLANQNDFDSPLSAFNEDIGELLKADIFVLIYPEKLPTSAIFEAGVAYQANKKLVFYCNSKIRLPYLLYGIESAYIMYYNNIEDIINDFKNNVLKKACT